MIGLARCYLIVMPDRRGQHRARDYAMMMLTMMVEDLHD